MPKPLLLMDLDRTLFDTASYFERIWTYASNRYGLDADAERAKARQYFDMYGESYDYRFFDHLRESVGEDFNQADFIRSAVQDLAGQFLYPDATPEVIGAIHAILTFGNSEHQTFKLSLCPELSAVERHIVLEPKGTYIARVFTEPTLLVDDKDFSAEIKPPARFVRIDRSLTRIGDEEKSDVIRTLTSLSTLLDHSVTTIDKS